MAWSASQMFRAFLTDQLSGTITFDLNAPTDTYKCALYDNDITPSKDVTSANSAYNVDQWVSTGNEQFDTSGWVVTGRALDSLTITNPASGIVQFDAADEVSGTLDGNLTNVTGCLIYNDTVTTPVADQGVCYVYFGGSGTATSGGTATVAFHANGIHRITLS